MKVILALFTLLLSASLYYCATTFSIWYLMWLAPIPILLFALTQKANHTLVTAFLIGLCPPFIAFAAHWPKHNISDFLSTIDLFYAITFCLQIMIYRWICQHYHHFLSIFVYPCIIVLSETLWGSFSTNGSLHAIATSQIKFLPIMQVASITGYLGISFLVSLFSSSIAFSVYCLRDKRATSISGIVIMGLIEIAALGFGFVRLMHPAISPTIKVGFVSPAQHTLFSQDQQAVVALKQRGAELIVFPEKSFFITASNRDSLKQKLSQIAAHNQILLCVGVDLIHSFGKYNMAWVFDHNGKFVGRYTKSHFMPEKEAGYLSGQTSLILPTQFGRIGITIGQDLNFTNPAKKYGQQNVGLVLVPAQTDQPYNTLPASAIIRGIENGFSIARIETSGLITVSDQYGHILSTSTLANVPIYADSPIYSQYGGITPWFCLILFLLLALLAYRHKGDSETLH